MSVEIRNEHIVKTVEHAHGLVGAFTAGCIIPSPSLDGIKPSKVSTVAGLLQLALERELYFNLHPRDRRSSAICAGRSTRSHRPRRRDASVTGGARSHAIRRLDGVL